MVDGTGWQSAGDFGRRGRRSSLGRHWPRRKVRIVTMPRTTVRIQDTIRTIHHTTCTKELWDGVLAGRPAGVSHLPHNGDTRFTSLGISRASFPNGYAVVPGSTFDGLRVNEGAFRSG